MNTLSATALLLSRALSWALLYSLWQGLLISGALLVLLRALRGGSARFRYYLSLGGFTALFAWFAATWVGQYNLLSAAHTITYHVSEGQDIIAANVLSASGSAATSLSTFDRVRHILDEYYSLVMLIYVIGLSFMLTRFVAGYRRAHNLKYAGTEQPSEYWTEMLAKLQDRLKIHQPVKLLLSRYVTVPTMIGALKPVVLLPVASISYLTTEQVEAILLHELAHIRRNDFLVNLLQGIGETVLFFNPFVWLISAAIRKERELCCDDLVVARTDSPLSYARALTILETAQSGSLAPALAATGNKNQLFNRIKRIMEMKKNTRNQSQLAIALVAIIAITLTMALFTFTPAFAQDVKHNKSKSDTAVKSQYRYKTITIDDKGHKNVREEVSDKPIQGRHGSGNEEVIVKMDDGKGKGRHNENIVIIRHGDDSTHSDKVVINSQVISEITSEIEKATKDLADVDWNELKETIDKSLDQVSKELHDPKFKHQIEVEVQRSMDDSRHAMEDGKRAMDDARDEMRKERREMVQIRRQQPGGNYTYEDASPTDYESMLRKMDKDGLIDRKGTFKIKTADGELFINGTRQPEEVRDKYKPYLEHKNVTIKGTPNTLNIYGHEED